MIISHKKKIIFIHNHKTGGSSVQKWLAKQTGDAMIVGNIHEHAKAAKEVVGEVLWDSCFTFGFVRNPWDRLVSWWNMLNTHRNNPSWPDTDFRKYILANAKTFDDFLNCRELIHETYGGSPTIKGVLVPQLNYFEGDTGQLVSFIGKFEHLHVGILAVANRCGLSVDGFPVINANPHQHYSTYYNKDTQQLVAEAYARDILHFGYSFERPPSWRLKKW